MRNKLGICRKTGIKSWWISPGGGASIVASFAGKGDFPYFQNHGRIRPLYRGEGWKTMKILGVDYGKVRTGLAICDAGELLATPLTVLRQTNPEKLAQEIAQIARENRVEHVVVGNPVNMDGTEGESAHAAQALAALLEQACGLPVTMRDERGTTVTAHQYLNQTDTRGKKRKAVVDAVAATIILQNYLDYRKNHLEK